MKSAIFSVIFLFLSFLTTGQDKYKTFCNPIDIDYTYEAHNFYTGVSYRAGADPAVINFKGNYYKLRALNTDKAYFFQVEAFSENGVGKGSEPVKIN